MSDNSLFSTVAGGGSGPAPKPGKVMLGSLDKPGLFVEAQFNPKELEVTRGSTWQKAADTNKSNSKDKKGVHLEFNGSDGRSLTLELLFDGYEGQQIPRGISVTTQIKNLEEMASVRDPGSTKEEFKRPHRCMLVWGAVLEKGFPCVIESLSTKYTMFDRAGNPLRAMCTLKLKEADAITVAKKK